MDSHPILSLIRSRQSAPTITTRRAALGLSLAGLFGGLDRMESAAKKRRHKKPRKGKENAGSSPANPCAGQNWCLDRTQTCGPEGGFGKCLVEATGDNICAEILFQVPSCSECEAPNCVDCRCVLAAGGGDRCNNGANGYDFICVRAV